MPELLEYLIELEEDVRYREPPLEGDGAFGFVRGERPVLLSAPHSAVHTRRGTRKDEEEFAAAMACLVAHLTDAHALYARRQSPTDPNWHADAPYKRRLRRLVAREQIHFVLDIHGMAPHRDVGIALGTMKGESCPEHRDAIICLLERHGFRRSGDSLDYLDVDQTFTARGLKGQETITDFAWRTLRGGCAQLELHPALRVVDRNGSGQRPGVSGQRKDRV